MPIPVGDAKFARKTLRETTMERIREAIYDGTLRPGEHLNDQELESWLGVSRTPIREALNDLARIGLIEMAPQRYTRVAQPNSADQAEIVQTLGALIGGVVRVTVPNLTDPEEVALLSAVDAALDLTRQRNAVAHGEAVWTMISLFLDACTNRYLTSATRDTIHALRFHLNTMWDHELTQWGSLESGYPELRAGIAERNAVRAELAVESIFLLAS